MRLERRPRFALFALSLLLSAAACTPRPAADSFVEEKGAVVYGSDTRRNYYEASASEKSWLSSTAVVTDFVNLTPQMGFERMGFADVNLCTGQKFEGEWILKNAGTAFLAWDDHTMITAAHVDPCGVKINCDPATDPNECFRETIVFGYQRIQSGTTLNSFGEPTYTETSSDRRYRCKDVILEDRARDFIVFTLDRSVPASEATPLVIAATSPAVGAPVKVVGYGHALPGKVSDGKVVERLRNGAVRTTLDMVQGNSGSPIMNASGQVVGVASYGAYRSNTVIQGTLGGGACFLWNICPETGCPDAEPECVGTRKDGTKCGTLPPTRPYPEPFAVMISVEAISESIARQGAPHRGPRGFDFNGDGSEDVAIGYPRFAETDTNPIDNSTLNGMVGVLMGGGPLDAARLAELFPGVDLSWSLGIPLPGLKVYGDGLWNVSLTPGERFGQTIAWGNFDDDDADELLVGSVGTKIRVLNHDGKGDDVIDSSVIPGLAKYPSFVVGDFNGDTYDDLAVTVSGGTAIRYGRPKTGLRGVVGTIQVIPFGGSYAVGDFNCDGYEDLAVAVKGTPDPVKQNYSGGVRIYSGSFGGLDTDETHARALSVAADLPAPLNKEASYMGRTLIAGNFNGDSAYDNECVDLAVRSSYGPLGFSSGLVSVFYGDPIGLNTGPTTSKHFFTGTTLPDLTGSSGSTDPNIDFAFGEYMSIADFNDDGFTDLYVGSPHGGKDGHGALRVLLGGASGVAKGKGRLYNCDQIAGTFPSKLCAWSGNEVNAIGGPSRGPIFVGGNLATINEFWDPVTSQWKGPESRSGIVSLVCPDGDLNCTLGSFAANAAFLVPGLMAGLRDLSDPATRALLTWLETGVGGLGLAPLRNNDWGDFGRSLTRARAESRRPIPPTGTFYMYDGSPLTGLAPRHSDPNGDDDGDTVLNGDDNCPTQANPTQTDSDNDGVGDVCQCAAAGRPPADTGLSVNLTPRGSLTDNQARFELELVNGTESPVSLKDLVIRYWYTNEGTRLQQFFVDASPLGLQSLTGTFVRTPLEYTGANSYVDIGFASSAVLDPGATLGPLVVRFARADFTNYDERDDYSRQGIAAEVKARAPGVELLSGGIGLWGKPPTPAYCSGGPVSLGTALRVDYVAGAGDAPRDQQMRPQLQLVNVGANDVALSRVELRYYFSGGAGTFLSALDYAALGSGVSTAVVSSPARPGSDRYIKVAFAPSLGSLAAGGNSGSIQIRANRSDFAALNETDDYSYLAGTVSHSNAKIVALIDGQVVWGTPP